MDNLNSSLKRISFVGLLTAVGIVFGDIGTSPLYVMKAIVGANPVFDADYITGAVSCVIWTLTLQTTVKYVLVALNADNHGEGGILALYALLRKLRKRWVYLVAAIGAAALIADGVITPAITVSSAVEGLRFMSADFPVMAVVVCVIIGIFAMQRAGTGAIGKLFGPFMLVWFLMLGIFGFLSIPDAPYILHAFNPIYAVRLLADYPGWFLVLGAVFLCTTGAEALYSDLGHCGRRNIEYSWIFVKVMLIVNYLGQGAWLIAHIGMDMSAVNPFYAIVPEALSMFAVIMSTGAAVIASQALLSGSFTIFSEAVSLNLWPRLRIIYPGDVKGQLYVPSVNWCLLAGCLLTVLIFRDSSHMEAAYGLAITITMLMTTVLLTLWLRMTGRNIVFIVIFALVYLCLEGVFFVANIAKFVHGGWYTFILALFTGTIMVIWYNAHRRRAGFIGYRKISECSDMICDIKNDSDIPKYASNIVYLTKSDNSACVESKIVYSIVNKQPKRADHYWFLRIENVDAPDTLEYTVDIEVPHTIYKVCMRFGYRVEPKVSVYFRQIVEDLVAAKDLDLTSSYPSLRSRGVAGDFRFIILHRIFSANSMCGRYDAFLMKCYERIRWMGLSDRVALGLDTSIVTTETVPLIINVDVPRRIVRVG